jgi:TPR repeat protein
MKGLRKKIENLLDAGTEESTQKAKALLLEEAQKNNTQAQLQLVEFFLDYEDDNASEALKWLTTAANQGSGQAAYYLSRLYRGDEFYPTDKLKALAPANQKISQTWFEHALELGYFEAQWRRAEDLFKKKDLDGAMELVGKIKKIKSSDAPDSLEALGSIKQLATELKEKISHEQKIAKSLDTVKKDASKMKPEMLYNTAISLLETDPEQAKRLLKMAADKGLVAARKKLSDL